MDQLIVAGIALPRHGTNSNNAEGNIDIKTRFTLTRVNLSRSTSPRAMVEFLPVTLTCRYLVLCFVVALCTLNWRCNEANSFYLVAVTRPLMRNPGDQAIRTTRSPILRQRSNGRFDDEENSGDLSESDSNVPSTPDVLRDIEELQIEINAKIVKDLPMFSFDFNEENLDGSALPVPLFTSTVIFLGSIAFTYYLYDVGINGFPDA
jgi:hypothetical protein